MMQKTDVYNPLTHKQRDSINSTKDILIIIGVD